MESSGNECSEKKNHTPDTGSESTSDAQIKSKEMMKRLEELRVYLTPHPSEEVFKNTLSACIFDLYAMKLRAGTASPNSSASLPTSVGVANMKATDTMALRKILNHLHNNLSAFKYDLLMKKFRYETLNSACFMDTMKESVIQGQEEEPTTITEPGDKEQNKSP